MDIYLVPSFTPFLSLPLCFFIYVSNNNNANITNNEKTAECSLRFLCMCPPPLGYSQILCLKSLEVILHVIMAISSYVGSFVSISFSIFKDCFGFSLSPPFLI